MSTEIVSGPWVTCPKPTRHARMRLFCFPYAGGNTLVFRHWPEALPHDVEICPIELPGRGSRFTEVLYDRLEPLIEAIAEAMIPHLSKPFALFGHSLGGLISFELARYLRKHHALTPEHLFVSGYTAPDSPKRRAPIHNLPYADFIEELRRMNGTPSEVLAHIELMQLLLPVLRADFAIAETYTYTAERPLDCPITVFTGASDTDEPLEDFELWRGHTNSRFTLYSLPGDHFFLHSSEALLLRQISDKLHAHSKMLM